MSQLFVLILQDPDLEQDVLSVWLKQKVPGVTMIESYGLSHTDGEFDELPLMPSLSAILRSQHDSNVMLWSILPGDFDVDGLVAATESVVGDLNEPNVGVAFTMPITRTWGLRKS